MLEACPRCQDLVLDDLGECRKCQKRFAPDRLPPLNKFEASKILMERQKEKAQLASSGATSSGGTARWLRYPLYAIGAVLALLTVFFMLHLVVIDLMGNPAVTATLAAMTLILGMMSSSALERGSSTVTGGGRISDVERQIRLLEDEVERLKKER